MKILIATPSFRSNKDGVSEAASSQVMAFLAKGWKVDVATEPTSPARKSMDWNGANVFEFPISGSSYFRDPYKGAVVRYCNFLRTGDWDVVLFHSYSWPLYLALPLLDVMPSKKILVSHGFNGLLWTPTSRFPFGLSFVAFSFIQSLFMLRWLKKIDRLVVLSARRDLSAFYDHTLARLINHPGIVTIPNGVDVSYSDVSLRSGHFRQSIGAPSTGVLFLCVANYCLRKDQGFAARAFRQASIPGSTLVFIGSELNDSSDKFRKAAASCSLDKDQGKILWLEKQARETTLEALADCDVFVLSSYWEAQPIAMLEAMAERKPWIARNAGCIAEMPGGLCVKSETGMAQAMKTLAYNSDLRLRLGRIGREATETLYNRKIYNDSFCRLVQEISYKVFSG
jgi:glycosyltransferase involved in cell wall biosynthesis